MAYPMREQVFLRKRPLADQLGDQKLNRAIQLPGLYEQGKHDGISPCLADLRSRCEKCPISTRHDVSDKALPPLCCFGSPVDQLGRLRRRPGRCHHRDLPHGQTRSPSCSHLWDAPLRTHPHRLNDQLCSIRRQDWCHNRCRGLKCSLVKSCNCNVDPLWSGVRLGVHSPRTDLSQRGDE